MHLCIVSPFPPAISGVGQYGWHVTAGLAETGRFRALTVLADHAPGASAGEARLPAPVTVRRAWRRDDPGAAVAVLQALLAHRPDAVWFNAGMTMFGRSRLVNFLGLLTPCLARRAGLPVMVTLHEVFETARLRRLGLHNGPITHWGAHLATRLLLDADAVGVTLRRYAALLRERYGASNIHHLPHGAFTDVALLPRPAGAPPHDILFFTSHAPHRGLSVLVEAFGAVRARFPDATLTIAGGDHPRFPGYSRQARREFAEQPGLRWLGPQTEAGLRRVMAQASLVAVPYLATTGASSVLNRAAALGRPVIASDLPDIRATAQEAGLEVAWTPPGDAPALARALMDLLGDPARQAALARRNVDAMRAIPLERTSARYADLIEAVAARTATAWSPSN